jgi:hypothetical protein
MTFTDWLSETTDRYRNDGPFLGTTESIYELYIGALRRVNANLSRGENIYDREWDILVLLDGCRVDLMAEVAPEYDFLNHPNELRSAGSSSIEWLRHTFTPEHHVEMRETAYITGNPFSHQVLETRDLKILDEVWRYAWDDDSGTIPAHPLTERAVDVARNNNPKRLIIHYMQPHFPSIPDPLSGGMNADTLGEGEGWYDPWDRLRRNELSRGRVWESYQENLRYVLDEVSLLRKNIDADRMMISSDHGNAAGEWWVYGHPKVPHSQIRQVPWYVTHSIDEETLNPSLEMVSNNKSQENLKNKLSVLGYR